MRVGEVLLGEQDLQQGAAATLMTVRPHCPESEPSAPGAAAAGMDATIWPSSFVAHDSRASGVAGSADETVASPREMKRLVRAAAFLPQLRL